MQLPVKAEYAAIAVVALAEKYASGDLVASRTIACEQQIPAQFLGQIFQQLRTAGIVISVRGSSGGFRLAMDPASLTLADVVRAICSQAAGSTEKFEGEAAACRVVRGALSELEDSYWQLLEKTTIAELLKRLQHSGEAMFYI